MTTEFPFNLAEQAIFARQPARARLFVSGADAQSFLHNMTTNDVKRLAPGAGCAAAMVNQRAGLLDHLSLYRTEDGFRLIGGDDRAEADLAWLDRYVITEDVTLRNDTAGSALFWLTGAAAARSLARLASGLEVAEGFIWRQAELAGAPGEVMGTDGLFGPGYYLLVPEAAAESLAAALIEAGAIEPGAPALEALRVSWGLPAVGRELVETRNPWEARLDGAISLAKGCYLGQEIVARLDAYDKVQRYLVGLTVPAGTAPGASLSAEGRDVGEITSVAAGPAGATLALAYVKGAFAAPGTALTLGEQTVLVEDRAFWQGKTRAARAPGRA